MLTQQLLKQNLMYDPDSGIFTWVIRPAHCIRIGDVAGYKNPEGYVKIGILGKIYSAHHLAFLYMNGSVPDGIVDHINRVRYDNRWVNLRVVTAKENSTNTSRAILVEHEGKMISLKMACEIYRVSYSMVKQRIQNYNCTPMEAILIPNKRGGNLNPFIKELQRYREGNL